MGNTGPGVGKNRHASGDDNAYTLTARKSEYSIQTDLYEPYNPHIYLGHPSTMGNTGCGVGKNQHTIGNDNAYTITATKADYVNRSDVYEPYNRQRSRTLPGQELDPNATIQKVLPTLFKWGGGGKDVYISGSFNNWRFNIPMVKSHADFFTIIELPEGEHQYKFQVDGQWMHSETDAVTCSDIGTQNNTLTVYRSDFDAFEALSADSETSNRGKVVEYIKELPPKAAPNTKGPPFLPPHLLEVILNKDIPANVEPSLLPEPNHVMLNHLYALSIKDKVMVLSATHRFRKKFVTTLLYKPIPE